LKEYLNVQRLKYYSLVPVAFVLLMASRPILFETPKVFVSPPTSSLPGCG
jgi:hypothetical protein